MPRVLHVRAFADNYIWLVGAPDTAAVAIVDPGDAQPVMQYLAQQHLQPVAIFCTHHHGDHAGGIPALRAAFDIPVYGPALENVRGVTHPVTEDSPVIEIPLLRQRYRILDIPGHTRGHIAFHGEGMVFCGDTLFSGGCGRLFEGTAAQLYTSLQKLAALPAETLVYCGHEYTVANLKFAQTVEPENAAIGAYLAEAIQQRNAEQATLPSTIARERLVNPFLRTHVPGVRKQLASELDRKSDNEVEVFARLRRWKDDF